MNEPDLPSPPVPPDADLRMLQGFILNVQKLLASELWALATGEEFKAAVGLWCRAWQQVPAGSLPNDDAILASFSGSGRRWPKVKAMAMRGFVLCSDGRFYHRALCDEAKKALAHHKQFQGHRERDAERLRRWRSKREGNADETHRETPHETRFETRNRKRKEKSHTDADASVEPDADASGPRAHARPPPAAETQASRQPAILLPIEGKRHARSARKSRLSPDWQPDIADCEYATSRGHSDPWIAERAEEFRDYHVANATTAADWHASWRTWVRRAEEFEHRDRGRSLGAPGSRPPRSGEITDALGFLMGRRNMG